VKEKENCPIETHSDVTNQIKKARIEGRKLHVNKIGSDPIIAQAQVMWANEEILIGSLGKKQYDDQIVHLLGQLPRLNTHESNDGLEISGGGGKSGIGNAGISGNGSDESPDFY
jgi:hypothetical protein